TSRATRTDPGARQLTLPPSSDRSYYVPSNPKYRSLEPTAYKTCPPRTETAKGCDRRVD
ncbi:hypothetical protein PISMIDRAFT_678889, partial [Pisolithus microcarpus 441]